MTICLGQILAVTRAWQLTPVPQVSGVPWEPQLLCCSLAFFCGFDTARVRGPPSASLSSGTMSFTVPDGAWASLPSRSVNPPSRLPALPVPGARMGRAACLADVAGGLGTRWGHPVPLLSSPQRGADSSLLPVRRALGGGRLCSCSGYCLHLPVFLLPHHQRHRQRQAAGRGGVAPDPGAGLFQCDSGRDGCAPGLESALLGSQSDRLAEGPVASGREPAFLES